MEKKFSIIFPTRNNITELVKALSSIESKTVDKDGLEVLLAVDDDDVTDYDGLKYGYDLIIHRVKRSKNFSDDYFNFLASKSVGKNIWVFSDDVTIETKNWDDIAMSKAGDKKIYMLDTFDSTRYFACGNQACFPIISRGAYNALGWIFYPKVRMYPSDRILYDIYKRARVIIPCQEVKLFHDRKIDKPEFQKVAEEDGQPVAEVNYGFYVNILMKAAK
jgi:glycosyltransferase involved in cell wall biosynthesis